MTENGGFITLPRPELHWSDPVQGFLWVKMAALAAYRRTRHRGVWLERGEVLLSHSLVMCLAGDARLSQNQVRRFLRKLEKLGKLHKLRSERAGTVYAIVDYDKKFARRSTSWSPAGDTPSDTPGDTPSDTPSDTPKPWKRKDLQVLATPQATPRATPQATPRATPSLKKLEKKKEQEGAPVPAEAGPVDAAARAYKGEVEDLFSEVVRRRPLTREEVSLVESWYAGGIPYDVVYSEMLTLAKREQARGNSIGSLKYFDGAVRAAFARPVGPAIWGIPSADDSEEAPQIDLDQRLRDLAALLPCETLRGRTLALQGGRAAKIEEELSRLELGYLASFEVTPEMSAEIESCLTGAVKRLRSHLPDKEFQEAMDGLRRQVLREMVALPVMTIFQD